MPSSEPSVLCHLNSAKAEIGKYYVMSGLPQLENLGFGPSADSNSRCLDQKTPVLINCAIQAQKNSGGILRSFQLVSPSTHLGPSLCFGYNAFFRAKRTIVIIVIRLRLT